MTLHRRVIHHFAVFAPVAAFGIATMSLIHPSPQTSADLVQGAPVVAGSGQDTEFNQMIDTRLGVHGAKPTVQSVNVPHVFATTVNAEQPEYSLDSTPRRSEGKEFGVWVWKSPADLSMTEVDDMLAKLKKDEVNAIYVTIDDYLDIAVLPAGASKTAKVQAYFGDLNRLIHAASVVGIAIDVVGGGPDWGTPGNHWKGYTLIEFVKNYHAQYPNEKIRALQYDVEPYLLPSYENNKASDLTDYVSFIDESMAQMQDVDAAFSIAIPHFFDATQQWTPPINYGEKVAYTFTHLLDIMQKKPKSTIHLMAYRNYFGGSNGVEGLSVPELTEASGTGIKMIIAQEVGNVSPAYVTFYGHAKSEFLAAMQIIYTEFGVYPSFLGVSINYLDPLLDLE